MAIQRISSLTLHSNLLGDITGTQTRLFNLQGQISSGTKAQYFKDMNGQVEQFSNLESAMARSENYMQNNTQTLARANTTRQTVSQFVDLVQQVRGLTVDRRNVVMSNSSYAQQMGDLLGTAKQMLNTNFEGRYLFSGTKTDTPPIKDPIPAPEESGVPDTGYYQGSDQDVVARVDDNVFVQWGVRADDPAFKDFFAAVSLALEGHADGVAGIDGADDKLAQAVDMLQSSMDGMIKLQTKLDASIVNIESINERHGNLKLYWQGVSESINKTDLVAASTQVAIEQALLQASFQAFAKINSLKLSDYLN